MIELRRGERPALRIGHRGAAALAPENTLASMRTAIELGVDVVEVDVLDAGDGTLVLAHGRELAAGADVPTLEEALDLVLRTERVGLQLDLKVLGRERQLVELIRRHNALGRTFVSSFRSAALREVARLEPQLPLSLTYPEDRLGLSRRRAFAPLVRSGLAAARTVLPHRIADWLARSCAVAATLHYDLATKQVIDRCHVVGAACIAWTVDDPEVAQRLVSAGIDGIITNDPRIFAGLHT